MIETNEKRYVANLSAYIYAETDEQAKTIAQKMTQFLAEFDDNNASIDGLFEQPKGTIKNRKVNL